MVWIVDARCSGDHEKTIVIERSFKREAKLEGLAEDIEHLHSDQWGIILNPNTSLLIWGQIPQLLVADVLLFCESID